MLNLFLTFFKIGILTFGGGYAMIPLISEELSSFNVDPYTFSNYIAISESTPGPFAINIATFIGHSNYGILGAIIATFGVILPSFIIMLLMAIFINKIKNTKFFKIFMNFSTPIVIGLILSSTLKITSLNLFNINDFSTIKETFNLNLVTLITFIILTIVTTIYFVIKKKRISPFKIITLSFILGFTSYLINLI